MLRVQIYRNIRGRILHLLLLHLINVKWQYISGKIRLVRKDSFIAQYKSNCRKTINATRKTFDLKTVQSYLPPSRIAVRS